MYSPYIKVDVQQNEDAALFQTTEAGYVSLCAKYQRIPFKGCSVCIVLELCNIQNFNHISRPSVQDTFNRVCVFVFNVLVFHPLGCREEAQVRVSETFMWLDDLQTPTDSPFCIDRRADRANWEYKSLYRGDIAR